MLYRRVRRVGRPVWINSKNQYRMLAIKKEKKTYCLPQRVFPYTFLLYQHVQHVQHVQHDGRVGRVILINFF